MRNYAFRCFLLINLLILLFSFDLCADDPKIQFRTIETEHFKIHYQLGLEDLARRSASILEEIHFDLSILFEWEIKEPIQVVIDDSTDSSNGWAASLYQPLIHVFATHPSSGSVLQYYDNYLRFLYIHEYTHLISLRIHSGFARVVNAIFGDVYFPNILSPQWYHEGITVLMETIQTTAGRIRSPYFQMVMRTAILENTFLSLGETSNDTRAFPRASGHYIYGAMFMNYLRSRFGVEKITKLYHVYGSKTLPYGLNRAFKEVFGADLITLYDQWVEYERKQALLLKADLEKQGLTESTRITFDGETKGVPIFSSDGSSLITSLWNGSDESAFYRIPLDGGPSEKLALANATSTLSIDRSGRVFFMRSAPYGLYYWFSDVFVLDKSGTDPRRITNGVRSRDVAVSPKGDLLAAATTEAGNSRLILLDEQGNMIKTLMEAGNGKQVYAPAWSPDGKTIAAVVRRGPQVDIEILDLATMKWTKLTDDEAFEDAPVFHPDGRYLLFASGRSGVDNIYALDIENRALYQVTNVLTGAMSTAVSPDGKTLAFLKYSSLGVDLHVMPLNVEDFHPAGPAKIETHVQKMRPLPPKSKAESKPYNPLPSFAPHFWKINAFFQGNGETVIEAATALYDATSRHSAGAVIDYYIKNSLFSGAFAYSYQGLGPGLHLGISRTGSPRKTGYKVDGKNREWIQDITSANLNLSFPVPGLDSSHSVSWGYEVTQAKPREEPVITVDPSENNFNVPLQYFRAGLSLSWGFSNTVTSPLGISPHKGRRISSSISLYTPYLGGKQTLASFSYGWSEYIAMPWFKHHVIAFRTSGKVYVSSPSNQSSMTIGGYGEQNIADVILNASEAGLASLRGYPTNAFEGDRFISFRLEYRFPIWFTEAAYKTLPVFLKRIEADVFNDNALISFDPFDRDDWRSSIGAEIVWNMTLGYFQPFVLRTGYAYGFMSKGIHEIIVVVGNSF